MSSETAWMMCVDPTSCSVRLAGRMDSANASAIYEAVASIPDPRTEVRLDLAGVTHCTTAFLTFLIDARSRLDALGSGLCITTASAHVVHLLDLHKAADLFQLVDA
jgi:anti-anti-sigma regulatory factor